MRTRLLFLSVAVLLLSGCAALTLKGDAPDSTEPPKSPSDLETTSAINRERTQAKTAETRYDKP